MNFLFNSVKNVTFLFKRKVSSEASIPQIKYLVNLLENTRKCKKQGKLLLPNFSSIRRAQMSNNFKVDEVYLINNKSLSTLLQDPLYDNIHIYSVDKRVLKNNLLSFLLRFDVVGICNYPRNIRKLEKNESPHLDITTTTKQLTVICDNIRDHYNLGNIFKILSTFKNTSVLLMKGCVDEWSWKVIEEADGCHLTNMDALISNCDWSMLDKLIPSHRAVFLADSNKETENTPNYSKLKFPFTKNSLQSLKYSQINYNLENGIVLILGGETEGVSEEGVRFCEERNGCRVHIPMNKAIDSLNSAISMAILLSEIRRKCQLKLPRNVNI